MTCVTQGPWLEESVQATETTSLPPDVALAYRRYVETHHGDLSNTRELALVMFNAGSRTALAASVAFSDIQPQMRYWATRLGKLADALETGLQP